ncbi:MAG: hypothetical protein B6D72_02115 [gamma proteobacterium symbiont of Ctena orbiculata]|nr:hypothetical protein [Candidatus Thiodiazotropha taylori]PUB88445.1 MAG: hypothetical protein DBP00_05860 [gamma proteobacterium symbiont of Ctena orbiculata]PVV15513.1 MAG: hypothetical protein B6D72_02115 [gamma proteobacterium symbiont of Ctena orbiculata]PVV15835.1 MAG: hypothetical protein B6D82_02575 [gamma proteobacterium symbiont of Ctena orbiculata]
MRSCCIPAALLLLVIVGVFYKFLWQGEVAPASDGRSAIQMPQQERDLVLREMRGFLQAVQAILIAVDKENTQGIVDAAREVGAAQQQAMPGTLVKRLPAEFKMLGFDTHRRFDQLALDAEQLGDVQHSLQQLAGLMTNCVSCHASYRLDLIDE